MTYQHLTLPSKEVWRVGGALSLVSPIRRPSSSKRRTEEGGKGRAIEHFPPGSMTIPEACRETVIFHYFSSGNNTPKYFFLSYQALVIDDPEIPGWKRIY